MVRYDSKLLPDGFPVDRDRDISGLLVACCPIDVKPAGGWPSCFPVAQRPPFLTSNPSPGGVPMEVLVVLVCLWLWFVELPAQNELNKRFSKLLQRRAGQLFTGGKRNPFGIRTGSKPGVPVGRERTSRTESGRMRNAGI
jgi:hypothetical protein